MIFNVSAFSINKNNLEILEKEFMTLERWTTKKPKICSLKSLPVGAPKGHGFEINKRV